jgi:cell division GTPase FtsZ
MMALERLADQGISISKANGVLACLHVSKLPYVEEIEDVTGTVHDRLAENANYLFGIIMDERLGNDVKVTILTLRQSVGQLAGGGKI